ncbi:type II secretion system protein GspM [Massilia sp. METH4]|uniref:type II secretion system protein GspM n=1 Tax=Massilia sp. METH4 TaxID=3123041 RepID=UPI0030D465BB
MSGLAGARASAAAFWGARTEQERRFLTVGGIVVGLALVYAVLIDPALTSRERLRKELPQLRQEAAQMQALATQAAQLGARPPVQVQPLSREALNAALAARGLTAQNLTVTGDYVKVEFKGVQFAGLVTWLDAARREERLAVQEAKIGAAEGKGEGAGLVDAALTLRQEAGNR